MIAKLKGMVDSLGDGQLIIDVNGVGYLVFASSAALSRLRVGEAAELLIETHVREDHIHLYGFLHASERDWFKVLTTVQGVGAKVGLAILGVLGADELMQAVAAQDKAAVSRAPGVGPKLAGRIVSELKDKVGAMALGAGAHAGGALTSGMANGLKDGEANSAVRDATSALVNLGYSPSDALGAVSRAAAKAGESGEPDVATLIRMGLSELGPKERL